MIYKYRKITDDFTTHSLAGEDITELTTIDGWTYAMIPDDVTLPDQSDIINETLVVVELSASENETIKKASPVIQHVLIKLNQDVSAYICNHYDIGTQNSLQAVYTNPDTTEANKTLIDNMFAWIKSCLAYYYTQKTAIITSDKPSTVTWDFSQFDASDPDISLEDFMV
jgi:hypothetical protein